MECSVSQIKKIVFFGGFCLLPHLCVADPPVYDATVGKLNQNKGSMKQGTKYTFSSL